MNIMGLQLRDYKIIYVQVWSENSGIDTTNKLSITQFLMKEWIAITNNTSIAFNTSAFVASIIKYAELCYSLFGKHKGELMPKPSSDVLKQICIFLSCRSACKYFDNDGTILYNFSSFCPNIFV